MSGRHQLPLGETPCVSPRGRRDRSLRCGPNPKPLPLTPVDIEEDCHPHSTPVTDIPPGEHGPVLRLDSACHLLSSA